jgi:uncharacterized protein DUF397
MNQSQALGGWRKSSRSVNTSDCVEVAPSAAVVGVRDTKDRAAGHLTVSPGAWTAFLDAVAE